MFLLDLAGMVNGCLAAVLIEQYRSSLLFCAQYEMYLVLCLRRRGSGHSTEVHVRSRTASILSLSEGRPRDAYRVFDDRSDQLVTNRNDALIFQRPSTETSKNKIFTYIHCTLCRFTDCETGIIKTNLSIAYILAPKLPLSRSTQASHLWICSQTKGRQASWKRLLINKHIMNLSCEWFFSHTKVELIRWVKIVTCDHIKH